MTTIGFIPEYESPKWRFLEGIGDILIDSKDGPAASLWEVLIQCNDRDYPLCLEGEFFSKKDLLIKAAELLPHIPHVVEMHVKKKGRKIIQAMCNDFGIYPEDFL
jgi:hypothetical protein